MRLAIFVAFAICPLLHAQPTARFEIAGKVLDADTGQPIANARVGVQYQKPIADPTPTPNGGFDRGGGYTAVPKFPSAALDQAQVILLTDQAGSFRLTNAGAGSYTLTADRAGYIRPNRADRPAMVNFSIGQNPPTPVTLYLRRQASLEGTVLDDRGFPVSGSVNTFKLSVIDGRVLPGQTRGTQVDPSGSFRITLDPGRYYVAFVPNRFNGGRATTYPVTIYPGVPDINGARLLDLKAGSQEQIHLRVKAEPAFELRGALPEAGDRVDLTLKPLGSRGLPITEQFSFGQDKPGTFHFYRVPAGEYLLVSRSGIEASTPITVTNQNIDNIVLSPASSAALQIRIAFDPPPDPKALPVLDAPRTPQVFVNTYLESDTGTIDAPPDPQGVRVARGLLPGVYRFHARVENPRYIRSARQGGRDALRDGVLVTTGGSSEPVDVVVGYGAARIEGPIDVLTATGQKVFNVLFLRRSGEDWAIQTQTMIQPQNPGKGFVIQAMPPGEYIAIAWNTANGGFAEVPYNTEAFHQKFGSYLERFTIRDTERVNIALRSPLPAAALEIY